ncbi:MAG: S16 family serine protease [Candidatus Bathyarchaeia archaeon]
MRGQTVALVTAIVILCLSLSLNVFMYEWLQTLRTRIDELTLENLRLKETLEALGRNIEYHPTNASPSGSWIYIVGVATLANGSTIGEVLKVYARFVEGSGNMFIATNPKIGIELQSSAETALKVAQQITRKETSNLDCMLTVVADKPLEVVDGPSAGAAITTLLTFTLQGREEKIRRDVFITGTIESDGTIGKVGGIIEKAIAAAKKGAAKFLVPRGQSTVVIYKLETTRIGPFIISEYIPEKVSVKNYLEQLGYSLEIIEVEDITEAIKHFQA